MSGPFQDLVEYKVADFAAERAFWCELVGLRKVVDEPRYVLLARDGSAFRLALKLATDAAPASGVQLSVQFWCEDLPTTMAALAARGLSPHSPARRYREEPSGTPTAFATCAYRSPAGVSLRLWATLSDEAAE